MKTTHHSTSTQFSTPSRESNREELSAEVNAGSLAEGLCYFLTLYLNDALSVDFLSDFEQQRKNLVSLLAEAGIKGARSKMKEYAEELDNLFIEKMEPALNQGTGDSKLPVKDWINLLLNTSTPRIIEFSVRENHAHILFRWDGDRSLEEQIHLWKQHFPTQNWSKNHYISQISEDKIPSYISFIQEDKRDETPLLTPISTNTPSYPPSSQSFHHITVLLHETVEALLPEQGKVIVDATLGGGGHSELLLEKGATVIGIDQDPDARKAAAKRLERFQGRFRILSGNFRDVEHLLHHEGITQVDGLLADIGVSSHQIDTPERGFSFREDGPLDMRMSPELPLTAADIVNTSDEDELVRIFREYGEERAARPLARLILQARGKEKITTTAQLAALAEKAIPRRSGHHPGTKIFQALRIHVNDELGALNELLDSSARILAPGGRLAIITFHSLEDRCVKRYLEAHSRPEIDRPEWPAPRPNPEYYFNLVNKKPITASDQELKINPRSRSAKLRAAQRIR